MAEDLGPHIMDYDQVTGKLFVLNVISFHFLSQESQVLQLKILTMVRIAGRTCNAKCLHAHKCTFFSYVLLLSFSFSFSSASVV